MRNLINNRRRMAYNGYSSKNDTDFHRDSFLLIEIRMD